jgi:hypothetical protein
MWLSIFFCQSQIVGIDYILNQKSDRIDNFDLNELKPYQTLLEMGFNKSSIRNQVLIDSIKEKTIYRIELYYSSYKEADAFSQKKLNHKRLEVLKKSLPLLFENNAIDWQLIEQREDNDKIKAQNLFHGFVFYARESIIKTKDGEYRKLTSQEEIDIIKNELGDLSKPEFEKKLPFLHDLICDSIAVDTSIRVSFQRSNTGKYWPKNTKKKEKGILYERKSIWKRSPEYVNISDTISILDSISFCDGKPIGRLHRSRNVLGDGLTRFSFQSDSVISKTLNNNNWKNVLVVEDVTGSMYPYLAQTFKWRRINSAVNKMENFVFFNDGDDRPDGPIGRSFGVYSVLSNSIKEVEEMAYLGMSKGRGGAGPENDIEAIIRGVEKSKNQVDNIILVADNFSLVRDISILRKLSSINIPVSVIVCGAMKGRVNYQYVDIARKTSGAVYTIEEEIKFSADLAEGMHLTVGDQEFVIRKGELVLIK